MSSPWWVQAGADVRLAHGHADLGRLAPYADTVVVIDVFSFTTCVSVAVSCGAVVAALPWRDDRAAQTARGLGALLAGPRDLRQPSLSPSSLRGLPPGTVLALASPNGAQACRIAAQTVRQVWTGCLRDVDAVAAALVADGRARPVLLAAAGERWPDGALRPAAEDHLIAGYLARLLAQRGLSLSAEAQAAAAATAHVDLAAVLRDTASARELTARGFADDVELSLVPGATGCVARLGLDGLLRAVSSGRQAC